MTKQEVVERCDKNVYAIWLEMAMRHYNDQDPSASFVLADNFIKELLCQNPQL